MERLTLPQKLEKAYEQQQKNEPYLCNKRTFQLIYTLEKRRADRDWHQAYLAKLRLRYRRLRQEDVEAAGRKLFKVLAANIRQCDVLTRFKITCFVMLLTDIRAQEVPGVMRRIKERYLDEPVYCRKNHDYKKLQRLRNLDLEWEYYQIS